MRAHAPGAWPFLDATVLQQAAASDARPGTNALAEPSPAHCNASGMGR